MNGLRKSFVSCYKHLAPPALNKSALFRFLVAAALMVAGNILVFTRLSAQPRRRQRPAPPTSHTQAPRASAAKYSAFLHSSEKHKSLSCNACHKIPTEWNAKRTFPDVADFPDHDACVRCHRQQFFTAQAFVGTGPAICTVCHVRAAPREATRFAFGAPNGAEQPTKSKPEWQFTIEFPHDKHQNVIASFRGSGGPFAGPLARGLGSSPAIVRVSFAHARSQEKRPDYNNCSICHVTNNVALSAAPVGWADSFIPVAGTFKTMPQAHEACFNCHWKNEKPASDDCGGCHKAATAFAPATIPKRISAKFDHERGGENQEHILECTTCHINITRASTVRGLTPDVPFAACATCHKDNKKTTYPKIVTIEEELEQYQKTSTCTYCHTSDVGKKKPPPSHAAAAR
jgi:Cytochrome c7 and related cytochrome c